MSRNFLSFGVDKMRLDKSQQKLKFPFNNILENKFSSERNHHNDETNMYNLQLHNVVCPQAHTTTNMT